jgi:hypothetical protein
MLQIKYDVPFDTNIMHMEMDFVNDELKINIYELQLGLQGR